jgi:type I restriction enzyme S subunit
MSADRLFAEFDRLSEAPEAVPRLRRFILDLAVRGRLVDQRPVDEPAASLLSSIRDHGSEVLGGSWVPFNNRPVDYDKLPFAAPPQWEWIHFGSIHDLVRGVTYTKSDVADRPTTGYLPVLRANNIGKTINFDELVYVKATRVGANQRLCSGDYLLALSSGSKNLVGKAAYVAQDYEAAFGGFCGVVRLALPVLAPYVGVFLASPLYREAIAAGSRGIGINNLNREALNSLLFPLPPLAEQQRIVAKVDELMDLCDQLEAIQKKRENRRDRLAVASLRLISGEDQPRNESRSHVRACLATSQHWLRSPRHIATLRQTIRALATRGQLIAQDSADESIDGLLHDTAREQDELVDARILKPSEIRVSLPDGFNPFDIPATARWVTLSHLTVFGPMNGVSPRASARVDATKAISLTATTSGTFDGRHYKSVDVSIPPDSQYWLINGDLLFQRGNTRDYVGMAALYDGPSHTFIFPDLMIKVRLTARVDARYIHLCSIAPYARTYFSTRAAGSQSTMPKINQSTLVSLPIPLPPVAEQRRIVDKVNQLMGLCDELERSLAATDAGRTRLLEAVLHAELADIADPT